MAKAGYGGGNGYADPPMSLRVTWTLNGVNDADYYVKVLLATVASPSSGDFNIHVGNTTTAATQMDYALFDYVQGAAYNQLSPTYTFKVQIIRKSDSAVIDTSIASGFLVNIGTCSVEL